MAHLGCELFPVRVSDLHDLYARTPNVRQQPTVASRASCHPLEHRPTQFLVALNARRQTAIRVVVGLDEGKQTSACA
jgi:hypothetical protein